LLWDRAEIPKEAEITGEVQAASLITGQTLLIDGGWTAR